MPANKYALLRYRIIDKCLRSKYNAYPSKEDLRVACEEHLYGDKANRVSASVIEKDLWAMRNETALGFFAPIEYSALNRGYYYSDENYSLDNVPVTDQDINAIRFAANTLYQFKDIELFDQFGSAIGKLLDRLDVAPQIKDGNAQHFIQFEQAPRYGGSKWLGNLLTATTQKRVIQFSYEKFGADSGRLYTVEPLLLKEYRNRWYLIGWNRKKKSIATFGLERITALDVTAENFEPRSDFEAEKYFKYCFGITSGSGRPVFVHILFETITGEYVKSQPLHKTQRIIKEDDNSLLVEIEVFLTPELIMHLMSFGESARVIKPKKLVEDMRRHLLLAALKYGDEE